MSSSAAANRFKKPADEVPVSCGGCNKTFPSAQFVHETAEGKRCSDCFRPKHLKK